VVAYQCYSIGGVLVAKAADPRRDMQWISHRSPPSLAHELIRQVDALNISAKAAT